jgi:probable F420-dependent oxidoreductase
MLPRIGVGLPHYGPHASPEALVAVAQAAERLGFASVWTFERLLLPTGPNGKNAYGLPEHNGSVYDPLESLTWAAAHTREVTLGTCVLDALFHPPVVLAKRLAALDRLSAGRLVAGVGQGWMPEEQAVTAVPASRRGAGFEEHLAAMRACWGPDPVEYDGRLYQVPRANVGPKPLRGRVPLLIGGVSQPAIERAARIGDGFAAVFQGWDGLGQQLGWYRAAGGTGTVVLRVNPEAIDAASPSAPFTGDARAVLGDVGRAGEMGVDELFLDLGMAGLDAAQQVAALERLAAARDG